MFPCSLAWGCPCPGPGLIAAQTQTTETATEADGKVSDEGYYTANKVAPFASV